MGGSAYSEPVLAETKETNGYKKFNTIFKNKTTGQLVRLIGTDHQLGYYPCDENGTVTSGVMIEGSQEVEKLIDFEEFKAII